MPEFAWRVWGKRRRSFSFMIVDVPAEIGAGYLQSASQASPPWASLLGHRKFRCDNGVIILTSDNCIGLPGWQAIDGASLHVFSRQTAIKFTVFLSFHHAKQWRATFCCKRAIWKSPNPACAGNKFLTVKVLFVQGKFIIA